jgi:methylmalonyl-CoA mutase C-terminal domain/subunit
MAKERKIRMLLAKLGADVHWRGAYTVAAMLRDAGIEVIYLDNAMPEEIIKAAVDEGVHVVGVSTLIGNHLTTGGDLIGLAKKKGLTKDTLFLIGGVFPSCDVPTLKELGYDGVFVPGSTQNEIAGFIENNIKEG